MSMVFRFRMLSDENDSFVREYEVKDDMVLTDFYHFICRDLDYDPAAMVSFFASDKEWNRLKEFTLIDMGHDAGTLDAPVAMDTVSIGETVHDRGDRLIFMFDTVGDRCYYLELVAVAEPETDVKYPLSAVSSGDAADQFAFDANANMSIFDEMMGDFADFEGDDSYDDSY